MSLTEQEELGITLFHKRCKLCLRQVDVAKRLYMDAQLISMYERGIVKTIPLETRIKLAQALDLSLEEILYDSEKGCLKLRRLKEDGNH